LIIHYHGPGYGWLLVDHEHGQVVIDIDDRRDYAVDYLFSRVAEMDNRKLIDFLKRMQRDIELVLQLDIDRPSRLLRDKITPEMVDPGRRRGLGAHRAGERERKNNQCGIFLHNINSF
jgi:hypothetical protein